MQMDVATLADAHLLKPEAVKTVRRRALGRRWRHLAVERLEDVQPSILRDIQADIEAGLKVPPGLPQGRHRTEHLLPMEGPPGGTAIRRGIPRAARHGRDLRKLNSRSLDPFQ